MHFAKYLGRMCTFLPSHAALNINDFEVLLCEQVKKEWRRIDQAHSHIPHVSSRVMRMHHTYFDVPVGS